MIRLHNKLLKNLHREAVQKHENLKRDWGEEFYECIKDIAEHPVVLRMKLYPHHGQTNCYQHCLHVAFYNYQWCRFFHLDASSAARAGMLHDLLMQRRQEIISTALPIQRRPISTPGNFFI